MVKKFSILMCLGMILAVSFLVPSVSASHRFLYYDSLLRRSDHYDILWQGPYQGGNLFVSISGSGSDGYNRYNYNPFYYTTANSNPVNVERRHRFNDYPSYTPSTSYYGSYSGYSGYTSSRFGGW